MRASQIGLMKIALGAAPSPAPGLTVNITTNQTNYNLFTAAGSPGTARTVTVNISSGVVFSSTSTGTPAFDEGNGWAVGTTITINNLGSMYGMGGAGGNGGSSTYDGFTTTYTAGSNGLPGGPALRLTTPTTIANASGFIFGGGGGGGGGCASYAFGETEDSGTLVNSGGGGGGGGQSASTSSAGNGGTTTHFDPPKKANGTVGSTGSSSSNGSKGQGGDLLFDWFFSRTLSGSDGGDGGTWGRAGFAGSVPTLSATSSLEFTYATIGIGGAAGKAVDLNGQSLTWISGNDSTRVKGPVS